MSFYKVFNFTSMLILQVMKSIQSDHFLLQLISSILITVSKAYISIISNLYHDHKKILHSDSRIKLT